MKSIINKISKIPITVKVSVAYAICSILQKCLSFITLPLFTRLLTTEQYGQYSIYTSWSAIIAIFVTLNLAYGSFQTAMSKYDQDRDAYISSVEGISILFAILFFIIYMPFRSAWNTFFELPTYLVVVMIIELVSQSSFMFWCTKKRFEFKYKSVVSITLLISIFSPLIAYYLVINTNEKGYARIAGYALVNILIGGFFFFYNIWKGKKIYTKEYWKFALGFNIPLIPYYLSQVVFNQSDRIMIGKLCGTDKAGIYSVAYTLAIILTFVLNAINNSYVPWLYQRIKENRCEENKIIASLLSVLMGVLLLGIIWCAPEIIYIMAGAQYYEAIWVVPPVSMSVLLLFYSQLFINVSFYFEQKKLLVVASIGSAICNIILNALMIPRFGYIAAGYTTLFSYVIFAASNYYGLKRSIKNKEFLKELYDIKGLVIIFSIMLVISSIAMLLYRNIILRYILVAIVVTVLITNIKRIINILKHYIIEES